jgi:hypothetical protein
MQQDPYPHNTSTSVSTGVHHVVVACLPARVTGTVSAARVATQLLSSFKWLRLGLIVGICGRVPSQDNDIWLGDVVVSKPTAIFGGVIQYGFGEDSARWSIRADCLSEQTIERATMRSLRLAGKTYEGRPRV